MYRATARGSMLCYPCPSVPIQRPPPWGTPPALAPAPMPVQHIIRTSPGVTAVSPAVVDCRHVLVSPRGPPNPLPPASKPFLFSSFPQTSGHLFLPTPYVRLLLPFPLLSPTALLFSSLINTPLSFNPTYVPLPSSFPLFTFEYLSHGSRPPSLGSCN